MPHQGSVSMVLFPLEMVNFSLPQQLSGEEKPGKTALITAGIHAGEYGNPECSRGLEEKRN